MCWRESLDHKGDIVAELEERCGYLRVIFI